jgi:hypothetical protein
LKISIKNLPEIKKLRGGFLFCGDTPAGNHAPSQRKPLQVPSAGIEEKSYSPENGKGSV